METFVLVAASGILAGAVHVVGGADHLAALLPLSVGRSRGAFGTGVRWGLGHSAGVLLIGLLAVAFKERLDLHEAGAWGERLVGVALVVIGVLGVRRALRLRIHAHAHAHPEEDAAAPAEHVHLHAHFTHDLSDHAAVTRYHGHAAFAAGTLHGVAGTAHLLGVLPAVALPGWLGSGAYLVAFAAGTVLAMGAFAALVGAGSARLGGGTPRLARALLLAAGVLTACVGAAWLVLATLPARA